MGHSPLKYTREQSLQRVYSINQAKAPDSFSAWHVVSGKLALDVRWAAVREDYAKAQFANIQQAREKLIRSGGALDKQTLQAALGKRQLRSRMWGISGQVALGVCISVPCEQQSEALERLTSLPAAAEVVSVEGTDKALQIWFRGPRALGDFLVQWCNSVPLAVTVASVLHRPSSPESARG